MSIKELKTNFVSGEQDPLLRSRSDVKAYYNGAEYLRNIIVLPQGGARSRPGSDYIWEVPRIPDVDGGGISDVRMFEFQFSTDQTFLFVFHHKAVAIFKEGVLLVDIPFFFTSAQLRARLTSAGDLISTGISVTQSRDTMFVFHQDRQPCTIKRNGSNVIWVVADYGFLNMPQFDFGDVVYTNGVHEQQNLLFPNPGTQGNWTSGDTFKLILEDEKTGNIAYTPVASALAIRIAQALNALPNVNNNEIVVTATGTTSSTTATFVIDFTGPPRPWGSMAYETVSVAEVPSIQIIVTQDGVPPGEDVWSNARGWPRCGVFFQGRLWMAGTKSLPNTVWGSRAGAFNDFNAKKIDDDYGISATTDTDDVPAFINIFAGRHLQLFSTAAEFYVPASETDKLTPANFTLRRTTSRGSKAGLRVYEVDGATIFVQRRGKALREFIFADVELAYQANNISLLASHLMRDPIGYALRRSSSTEDADYIFLPNGDGTMTVFCTLRTQEVNAMTLWNTQGNYDDCAVVLDEVYFSVLRTVNGIERKFIERMNPDISVDCAISGGAANSVSLPHLPSTLIEYEVDGFVRQPVMSSNVGLIAFDRPSATQFSAGLKFAEVLPDIAPGYIWAIRTLPFETQLPDGAAMGRKRRIVSVDVRLYDTTALYINGTELSFRQFGVAALNTPPPIFTGVKRVRGFLGWDFEGQVLLGSDRSTKATVLGLAYSVSIG